MDEDTVIRTPGQLENILKSRRENADKRIMNADAMNKPDKQADHAACASQAIKVINALRIDPFVKKVMTLRLIGPIICDGRERTHLSIALELGATEEDVRQAEEYGIEVVGKMLQVTSTQEFIEKYNRNRAVENAVNQELGNSA